MNDPISAKIARQILNALKKNTNMYSGSMKENPDLLESIVRNTPLRSLTIFGKGAIEEEMINKIIQQLNSTT